MKNDKLRNVAIEELQARVEKLESIVFGKQEKPQEEKLAEKTSTKKTK